MAAPAQMALALALVAAAARPEPPILATTLSASQRIHSASARANTTYSQGEVAVDVDAGLIRKVRRQPNAARGRWPVRCRVCVRPCHMLG